tara:strand:+ start:339 stop:1256 length:918 start_codon:yes stop_codon:yes gene_type:complete
MNVENVSFKSSKNNVLSTKLCVKSVAVSISLLLGACAVTGDNTEQIPTPDVANVEKVEQKAEKAPAPSAAELMKTLKAPLVEPPSSQERVVQVKVEPASVPVQDVDKKVVAKELALESPKKSEAVKVLVLEKTQVAPEPKKVEQVVVAEIEKPTGTNAKPFNISAKKLPFSYDIWTIREGNTPLTKGLVITTPTWEMGKEGYMSQIWFTMMEDAIHVNSSSDIEPASKGLGIRIDGGDLIPFTSLADNNIGVISGQWLDRLAAANKVDVYLGFFPGKKPTSDTFTSDLSLSNLARMVATYRVLNQ